MCLSLLFILASCEKEEEYRPETTQQSPFDTSDLSSILGVDEDCSDQIHPDFYHLNSRSASWHLYNDLLEDKPLRTQFGKPYYGAALSDFEPNTRSSFNTIPLFNYETEELETILFLESEEIGIEEYHYTFLETSILDNIPSEGITFDYEGETITITREDYVNFKNYLSCLATCDQEGIVTRHDIHCYDFGTSWWTKFKKWWRKTFTGTDGTSFPINESWVPDADPFWTGTGQGPKFNIGGKGGSSYTPPPYLEDVERLKFCFGFEDVYDVDPMTGGNENAIHPDFEFCKIWQTYMDDCFGNIPYQDQEEFYTAWGQNMYYENSLFNDIIENPEKCYDASEFNCLVEIENYEDKFDIQLSKEEKEEIFKTLNPIECSEEEVENSIITYFENINFIVEVEDDGAVIDLIQMIENCFGSQDEDGNFLDCSNENDVFNFTIYVDQPTPGSSKPYSGSIFDKSTVEVGHTFVSLTHTSNGVSNTMVFGLYPLNGVNPSSPESPRAIVNDGSHAYDIAMSYSISCDQFNDILNEAASIQGNNYNLNSNNCTDFGLNLGGVVDCCIPDSQGFWGFGSGSNPGALGEDLKGHENENSTILNGPGIAPATSCN